MANNEAALLIKLLADKSNLDVTIKSAEGAVTNFQGKVERAGNSFAQMGNNLLKIFGVGMMVRQLGLLVMQMDEVAKASDKVKAQSTDMFERTLKPGLPFIVTAIKSIGTGLRVLIGILDLVGTHIGGMMGLWVSLFQRLAEAAKLMVKGDLRGAAEAVKGFGIDIKAYQETMIAGWKRVTTNFEISSKARIKQSEKELSEQKKHLRELAMEQKRWDDIVAGQRKKAKEDQKELDRKSQEDTIEFNNAFDEATAEKFNKIQGYYNKAAESLANVTTSWLNGEKDAWKNWADDLIKQIERVILKKLFLNMISGIFGGAELGGGILGKIGNFLTGNSSARPTNSGNGTIQIITADPATTVRFINSAYGQVGAAGQAGLYRNVQRGSIADSNR